MDISKLHGSEAAKMLLKHEGLFHAYILSGGNAAQRRALADYIAAAAVCSAGGKEPCNACANCRKAGAHIHPDILRITRQEGKREIYVNQMREIKADTAVLPNEAARKVYIIEEADTMNSAAQNAMLKVLEEPPAYAVFLLLAENPRMLLGTVRSRCVELSLAPQEEKGEDASYAAGEEDARLFLQAASSGDKMALLSFLFERERMEKEELKSFALAVRRLVLAEIQAESAKSALSREELYRIAGVFWEIQRYTDANVSAGHAVNLLLAAFI